VREPLPPPKVYAPTRTIRGGGDGPDARIETFSR
jgi:hypothetical protein